MRMARRVHADSGVFGKVVKGFDRGDLAEALVGSVVFGVASTGPTRESRCRR